MRLIFQFFGSASLPYLLKHFQFWRRTREVFMIENQLPAIKEMGSHREILSLPIFQTFKPLEIVKYATSWLFAKVPREF
jgi:hypothetical protein